MQNLINRIRMRKQKPRLWTFSKKGIECPLEFYDIEYERFHSKDECVDDWLKHLKNKVWFDSISEQSFLEAYYQMNQLNKQEDENNV